MGSSVGTFSQLMIVMGGPSPQREVPPGQVILGCTRKQAEEAIESKLVSNCPLVHK